MATLRILRTYAPHDRRYPSALAVALPHEAHGNVSVMCTIRPVGPQREAGRRRSPSRCVPKRRDRSHPEAITTPPPAGPPPVPSGALRLMLGRGGRGEVRALGTGQARDTRNAAEAAHRFAARRSALKCPARGVWHPWSVTCALLPSHRHRSRAADAEPPQPPSPSQPTPLRPLPSPPAQPLPSLRARETVEWSTASRTR